MEREHWVYILECRNGHYYTGSADDMADRFRKHVSGKSGAKYTRSFKPLRIARCWKLYGERGDALKVESCIKSLSRNKKEELIESPEMLLALAELLSCRDTISFVDDAEIRMIELEATAGLGSVGIGNGQDAGDGR